MIVYRENAPHPLFLRTQESRSGQAECLPAAFQSYRLDCGYRVEKPPGQARNDSSPAFSYLGVSKPLIMIIYRKNTSIGWFPSTSPTTRPPDGPKAAPPEGWLRHLQSSAFFIISGAAPACGWPKHRSCRSQNRPTRQTHTVQRIGIHAHRSD